MGFGGRLLRAGLALSRASPGRRQARSRLDVARRLLAAEWGQRVPTFEKAEAVLSPIPEIPPFEKLARLISNNPDVARWPKVAEKRRAALELEKARAVPELTLGAGAEQFGNDTGPVVSLSMALPVFERNQGNILAARYKLDREKEEAGEAVLKANTALSGVYHALVDSCAEAEVLKNEALPDARRLLNIYRKAYQGRGAASPIWREQTGPFSSQGALHRKGGRLQQIES